jgi:hypothetical protein
LVNTVSMMIRRPGAIQWEMRTRSRWRPRKMV